MSMCVGWHASGLLLFPREHLGDALIWERSPALGGGAGAAAGGNVGGTGLTTRASIAHTGKVSPSTSAIVM